MYKNFQKFLTIFMVSLMWTQLEYAMGDGMQEEDEYNLSEEETQKQEEELQKKEKDFDDKLKKLNEDTNNITREEGLKYFNPNENDPTIAKYHNDFNELSDKYDEYIKNSIPRYDQRLRTLKEEKEELKTEFKNAKGESLKKQIKYEIAQKNHEIATILEQKESTFKKLSKTSKDLEQKLTTIKESQRSPAESIKKITQKEFNALSLNEQKELDEKINNLNLENQVKLASEAESYLIKKLAQDAINERYVKNPKDFPTEYIKSVAPKSFSLEELFSLPTDEKGILNVKLYAEQIVALRERFNYFYLKYPESFKDEVMKYITPSLFSIDEISTLSQKQIDQLSRTNKINALKNRIDQLFIQNPQNFPDSGIRMVSPEAISKLSLEQLKAITSNKFQKFTPEQRLAYYNMVGHSAQKGFASVK